MVSKARVREAATATLRSERVKSAMLSITFVGRATMAGLNKRYLGHHGATDVISFGFDREGRRGPVIGDVYICPEIARENARRQGVSAHEEFLRLVVHGTLHVLGYEHPKSAARSNSRMWRKQEKVLGSVI